MQVHRVAVGCCCVAVAVGDGEHAAFIGPGALLVDAVGSKVEGIGAVGVEGQDRAAVVGGDGQALAIACAAGKQRSKIRRGDGVVAGELIGGGGHVVQVHRIAVGCCRVAVAVGDGERAGLIGPGALLVDAVGLKIEGIGAVGVEGEGGAAVVRGDDQALGLGGLAGLGGLFFLALGLVGHDGGAVQGPDGLGHEVQNRWLVIGVIHAVGVVAAHVHLGRALHLLGVGIGLHGEHRVLRRGGGDGAVAVVGVGAGGHGGEDQAKAGVVADLGALAALDDVGVRGQGIRAVCELQRQVDEEAGVRLDHARQVGAEELRGGHILGVAVVLVVADGVGAAALAGLVVGGDGVALKRPDGLGHEVQHRRLVVGVIFAVGVVAAHVHLGRALHLLGVGIGLHGEHRVLRRGGGDGAVAVVGVGAGGHGGEDQAKAGVVADLGALAALDDVGVGGQGVSAAFELELLVDEEAGVCLEHAGQVRAEELIAGHVFHVVVVLVEADGIGALQARAAGTGLAAEHAAEVEGGQPHGHSQGRRDDGGDDLFDGLGLGVGCALLGEGADNVEDHGDQQQHRAAQGEVDGLLAAVTGVIVGDDAVADALDPVAHDIQGARSQKRSCAEGQNLGPHRVRPLAAGNVVEDQKHDGRADQNDGERGLHLAEDIVAGGEAQDIQSQAQNGQDRGDEAAQGLKAGLFLLGHITYSFLSAPGGRSAPRRQQSRQSSGP